MNVTLFRARTTRVLGALLLLESTALAQPAVAPPPPAVASPDDKDVEARRTEAKASFEKGNLLLKQGAWDAALAEFGRSRASYPTRAATKNAAICLSSLRRFDEALDMFEEVLKFSNLPAEERAIVERTINELQERMGALKVEGGEPGASIVIDGRYRGTLPLPGAVRVAAGSHEVSAFKEGLDPFGATIEVFAKQTAVVRLRSLSTGGRLKVSEQKGRALEVVVDGTVMGKTPWEGPLRVGEHLVTLRGSVNLDAIPECAPGEETAAPGKKAPLRGNVELGTQPVSVPIRLQETTKLTLTAEALDTTLRVEPTPGGAQVSIDSVVVGQGAWEGRLRVGEHTVEVSADGFLPETRRVSLERRKRQVVTIALERNRDTAGFRAARKGAVASLVVGAAGLGVGAVTGILAFVKIQDVESRCAGIRCPPSERANVGAASTLGNVSTTSLVLGGLGVAAGSILLISLRPGGNAQRAAGAALRVGAYRLDVEGSF
ncbi:MAG: PEGA domain-containing protein [Byssovorax sp.]